MAAGYYSELGSGLAHKELVLPPCRLRQIFGKQQGSLVGSKMTERNRFIFVACRGLSGGSFPGCGLACPEEGGDAVGIWKWSSAGPAS